MKDVYLISSLGMSPGVVTGVIDALQYEARWESYNAKYVAIITTDHKLTRLSLQVIERDMQRYNQHIQLRPYIIDGLSDIHTYKDNFKVMKTFIAAVKEGESLKKQEEVEEIHVNIAGGRKTMSGVFTALSGIFPVNKVYHLLTSPKMERAGNIRNFLTDDDQLDADKFDSEDLKHNLHPKVAGAPSTLVEIPILHSIDFEDLLDFSIRIGNQREISEHELTELMRTQGFLRRTRQKGFQITQKGKLLFKLFQHYKSL